MNIISDTTATGKEKEEDKVKYQKNLMRRNSILKFDMTGLVEMAMVTIFLGTPLLAFFSVIKSYCAGFILGAFYLLLFRMYRKMR